MLWISIWRHLKHISEHCARTEINFFCLKRTFNVQAPTFNELPNAAATRRKQKKKLKKITSRKKNGTGQLPTWMAKLGVRCQRGSSRQGAAGSGQRVQRGAQMGLSVFNPKGWRCCLAARTLRRATTTTMHCQRSWARREGAGLEGSRGKRVTYEPLTRGAENQEIRFKGRTLA